MATYINMSDSYNIVLNNKKKVVKGFIQDNPIYLICKNKQISLFAKLQ